MSSSADPSSPPAKPAESLSWQVGAVVFGRVLVSLVDSLKAFIIVRLLSKDAYGTLALALNWYGVAVTLALVGLPDALMVLLPPADAPERQRIARTALVLAHGLGLLAGGVLLALGLGGVLVHEARPDLQACVWVAAALLAIDLPGSLLAALLLGQQQHQRAVRWNLAVSTTANVAMLGAAALGASPPWILSGLAASGLLRLATVWRTVAAGPALLRASVGRSALRELLDLSVPLSFNAAAGTLNRQLSTWLAGGLLTAANYADFALSAQELPFVSMIPNAVMVALLPHLRQQAAAGDEGRREMIALWHRATLRIALVMIPLCVLTWVEAPSLLQLLYERRYLSALAAFRMSLATLPLRVTTYGTLLLALALPRPILTSQLLGLGLQAMLWLALWTVGPHYLDQSQLSVAAVLTQVVGAWTAVLIMLRAISLATQVPWPRLMPWSGLGLRWLLALVAVVPSLVWTLVLPSALPITVAGRHELGLALVLAVRLLLFAAVYLSLLLALGLLDAADRATLWSWLRLEPIWRRVRR